MPITELPAVAKSFFAPCKKCDSDRYHKVLAHSSATSAKVQCEVCGSRSTYKLPKLKSAVVGTSKKPARKVGESSARSRASHSAEYEKLMSDTSASIVKYSMKAKFEINQKLEHPKFGMGLVRNVQIDKIEVVFVDEIRSLIHNRT